MVQPPPILDAEYVGRVSGRADTLQRYEIRTRQEIAHTQQALVRATADIEMEMESLKIELSALELDMRRTIDRVKFSIGQFKQVVKRGDLERLQRRADLWAPESRITREQFKTLVKNEMQ